MSSDGSGGPDGADSRSRHRPRRRPRVGATGARFPRPRDDDPPADMLALPPGAGAPALGDPGADGLTTGPDGTVGSDGSDGPVADELVGRTGARFNSRARRTRRERERDAAQDAVVSVQADPVTREGGPAGTVGAAPGTSGADTDAPTGTDGAGGSSGAAIRIPGPLSDDAPTMPFLPDPVESSSRTRRTDVRPYIRTGGRTRPRTDLALETMVSVPTPRPAMDDPEHRAIGDLCDDPRSVAEVAALLAMPLGVARVLIDDMAVEGLLRVHSTAGSGAAAPDLSLLERVLSGLHRL